MSYAETLRNRWDALRTGPRARRAARVHAEQLGEIERFCFFVGFPRSGTTLAGQLLNAHRHVVIAHELDAFTFIRRHPVREQLFGMLIEQDQRFCDDGLIGAGGYEFAVPGQWQGRAETVRVVGDKKAAATTVNLRRSPELLDTMRSIVGVPIRVVCISRNPFDTIATMASRSRTGTLEHATDQYNGLAETLGQVRAALGADELIDLRHEDLVADPAGELRRLCSFIGVDTPDDYLEACQSIVFPSARRSRDSRDWPSALTSEIEGVIGRHAFLSSYSLT